MCRGALFQRVATSDRRELVGTCPTRIIQTFSRSYRGRTNRCTALNDTICCFTPVTERRLEKPLNCSYVCEALQTHRSVSKECNHVSGSPVGAGEANAQPSTRGMCSGLISRFFRLLRSVSLSPSTLAAVKHAARTAGITKLLKPSKVAKMQRATRAAKAHGADHALHKWVTCKMPLAVRGLRHFRNAVCRRYARY